MIRIYRWKKAEHACQVLEPTSLRLQAGELRACGDAMWIDLDEPTEEEEQLVLQEFFPVHPLTREDVTKLRREPGALPHFPKVEEFSDYLFVIVNPLRLNLIQCVQQGSVSLHVADDRPATQLSAILSQHFLITHHYEPVLGVQQLQAYLKRHEAQGDRGPDYLFHLILDTSVDQYAPVLDHFDDSLDALETRVLREPTPAMLQGLLRLKRDIIGLRKTLIYEREVLARLIRGEFSLIEEREIVYYRNVYDHLVRFTELIESSREMVTDLLQTHLSATSNRLNAIMKGLTTISTIVLPMTLVAGVYGMNFTHMPEIEWVIGYPLALALMGLTGVGSFLFFRWKKWI